jgi:hypothetical protein
LWARQLFCRRRLPAQALTSREVGSMLAQFDSEKATRIVAWGIGAQQNQ